MVVFLIHPLIDTMDFSQAEEHASIRDAVGRICAQFDDHYWLEKDRAGGFPHELHRALADSGWLGICLPVEYGGSGMGNLGGCDAEPVPCGGHAFSMCINVPPLAAVLFADRVFAH